MSQNPGLSSILDFRSKNTVAMIAIKILLENLHELVKYDWVKNQNQ